MSMQKKTTLTVEGMTCNKCISHVTRALSDLPGVSTSQVDLGKGSATVEHDESVSGEELVAAITEAGYQASVAPPS